MTTDIFVSTGIDFGEIINQQSIDFASSFSLQRIDTFSILYLTIVEAAKEICQ